MKKRAEKGFVTIAFDDAYLATYRHAVHYLTKRKIASTIAVPASLIGKSFEGRPLMGKKELARAIKTGHEIASHTLTHPNLLKLNAKNKKMASYEIAESKRALGCLLHCKVSTFVFPYIKKNISRNLYLTAKKHYKSVRITSEKPCFEEIPAIDRYDIAGFAVMKKHSLSYLNKLARYARENDRWLIEVFHLVSRKNTLSAHRPKPYRYFMHIEDFKKHVDYILSKGIPVRTLKEAMKTKIA